jgi:hypothetical protein
VRRKRNNWDSIKRQKRVSQNRNPAFMLDPRHISYGEDEKKTPPSMAENYIMLEQHLVEFLCISSNELKKRITDSLNIDPVTLTKIINGNLGKSVGESSPWVRLLIETKMFNSDRFLRALLSETEFLTLQRAEWVKNNIEDPNIEWSKLGELSEKEFYVFQQRETKPKNWSAHGKLNLPKLDALKS